MSRLYQTGLHTWVVFALERLLIRGAHFRFLVVAALIGVVAVCGGLAVRAGVDNPASLSAEVWWAFLRLSDPGYLGDDQGLQRRVISTALTVLGYVIFLGAMVAILTQWLNATLQRLELGLTPVRMSGHVVILGWTRNTRAICRNLHNSQRRVTRWLELQKVRRLRIAILARTVGPERIQELRDLLGNRFSPRTLVLRSGSALRANHLARVDLEHAGCVVIPGVEGTSGDAEDYDAVVLKTLRMMDSLGSGDGQRPSCVCEVLDPRRIPLARRAYRGALEVVASDVLIGRLLAYTVRQPGLGALCLQLLTHGTGATLFVCEWEEDAATLAEIQARLRSALVIGVIDERSGVERCTIAPPLDERVEYGTRLIQIAAGFEDTRPQSRSNPFPTPAAKLDTPTASRGRVLILGWSRRVPDLIQELARRPTDAWSADILSVVPARERLQRLQQHPELSGVTHFEGDPTVPDTLRALDPARYDRIVLVATEWMQTGEESDARTIATYLCVEELLDGVQKRPEIVAELLGVANAELLEPARAYPVVSPQITSHAISQIVLRRELRLVLDEIFGDGPAEVVFVRADKPSSFAALMLAAAAVQGVAVGVRRGGEHGQMLLLPPRDELIDPNRGDEVIVIQSGSSAQALPNPATK